MTDEAKPRPSANCGGCAYYARGNDAAAQRLGIQSGGRCRRYPTEVRHNPEDWCGEFHPKAAPR